MPKMSEQQDVEEVNAPIYAWRAYRVEQIAHNYEAAWFLTPLYYRSMTGGRPMLDFYCKRSAIQVDPLGWNEADVAPEMNDGYDPYVGNGGLAGKLPGFHCFHGYGQAIEYVRRARQGSAHIDDVVVAKVELGGVVVEHELGYRAQMTRIVALEHNHADEEIRAKLAAALGWPFEIAYCDLLDDASHSFFSEADAAWIIEQAKMLAQLYGMSVKQVAEAINNFGLAVQKQRIEAMQEQMQKLMVKANQFSVGMEGLSIKPDASAFTEQLRRDLEAQIKSNWISQPASQKPFDLGTGA